MNIHFIGIGGIGISALAQFCHKRGDTITGSEISETSILKNLRAQGIDIVIPQKLENIPKNCDLVIYTEAVSLDNPERREAKNRDIPVKSYFQYLGEISKDFNTIAVCGTHGKTTTVGLLSSGFQAAKFDATVFVGSKLREFKDSNFYRGTNDFLLLEACEYRNNFQFLRPEIVILTNAELDHTDYYLNQSHYRDIFTEFCSRAHTVIHHEDDLDAHMILQKFSGKRIAVPQNTPESITLEISGHHNRKNAALALTLSEELGLPAEDFKKGLKNYTGAWRRQEYLGEKNDIKIFDDYGHHPTEVAATLQAFREHFPGKRIGLIFEPHQFSRTKQFFDEFCEVLSQADETGIFPIYEARDSEEDKKSVSIKDLISNIPNSMPIKNHENINKFAKRLAPGDILIFMGAGDIDEFARKFMNSYI